jgi:hypothetical protein
MRKLAIIAAIAALPLSAMAGTDVDPQAAAEISQQLQDMQKQQLQDMVAKQRANANLRAKTGQQAPAPQAAPQAQAAAKDGGPQPGAVTVTKESAPPDIMQNAAFPMGAPQGGAVAPAFPQASPAAKGVALTAQVAAPAPAPAAAPAADGQGKQADPETVPGSGCPGTGDLAQLLSPGCIESLKPLRGSAALPPPPQPIGNSAVTCAASVFIGQIGGASGFLPQAGSGVSFRAPSLASCIMQGARLGFGANGVTNIVAFDDTGWSVAVSCRRTGPDGRIVNCSPQPALGQ